MEILKKILLLAALINPLGAIPFFISITEHQSPKERQRITALVAITVCIVIAASALIGRYIIEFFNISIASLQVGGGLVVLLMALGMVRAETGGVRNTPEEMVEAGTKSVVAVVPLGIPILTGPVTISTVIVYATQAQNWYERLGLVFCGIVLGLLVWIALRLAEPVSQLLGRTGINIATRLSGLLLAAMSVEFIAAGLSSLFPVLQGLGK
jgi:multiple antibiotic resistance protein